MDKIYELLSALIDEIDEVQTEKEEAQARVRSSEPKNDLDAIGEACRRFCQAHELCDCCEVGKLFPDDEPCLIELIYRTGHPIEKLLSIVMSPQPEEEPPKPQKYRVPVEFVGIKDVIVEASTPAEAQKLAKAQAEREMNTSEWDKVAGRTVSLVGEPDVIQAP
ncbi:MAG: hypothetical protein IKD75_06135 [Prevotella sp.]|nr:hypothetical protein [Prevotella sp.]